MNFLDLCLVILATHRLTALWMSDEILRPLREAVTKLGGKIAFGANCAFCVSVWAAVLAVAFATYVPVVNLALAASMGVMFLDKVWAVLGAVAGKLNREG